MAGFQPAPDVVGLVIKAQQSNQDCFTIWNVVSISEDTPTPEMIDGACAVLLGAWEDNALPLLGSNYIVQSVDGQYLGSMPGATGQAVPSGSGAGTMVATFVPANCSICVRHRTGLSGRNFNGRSYWPELPTSQVADSVVDADYANDVRQVFQDVAATLVAGGWRPVVLSRWLDKALRAEAIYTAITGYSLTDRIVDSMRRRLPKRGS